MSISVWFPYSTYQSHKNLLCPLEKRSFNCWAFLKMAFFWALSNLLAWRSVFRSNGRLSSCLPSSFSFCKVKGKTNTVSKANLPDEQHATWTCSTKHTFLFFFISFWCASNRDSCLFFPECFFASCCISLSRSSIALRLSSLTASDLSPLKLMIHLTKLLSWQL